MNGNKTSLNAVKYTNFIYLQSDESVKNAAAIVKSALGDQKLFGLVNNAGTGLGHGTGEKDLFNTNVYGPKRVYDNFISLMDPEKGRIVNMGSGAGPGFVKSLGDVAVKKQVNFISCFPTNPDNDLNMFSDVHW